MENNPIHAEALINAKPEKVWNAITRPEQMKEWYFALDDFRAEKGFEFSFTGQGLKGESYLHLCKITEVVPNKKLQYTWSYKNYPGSSLVTFELSPIDDKTRVQLTHSGVETFATDNPDFDRKNFVAGWNEIIPNLLKSFVEKSEN